MTVTGRVDVARKRTPGNPTKLLDEWSIPPILYYPWQWSKRLRDWPVQTTGALLALFWISATGSLFFGIVLGVLTLYMGLTGWVGWRRRGTHEVGAEAPTIRSTMDEQKARRTFRKHWVKACDALGLVEAERKTPPVLHGLRPVNGSQFIAEVTPGSGGPSVERIAKSAAELASLIGYTAIDVRQTSPGKATVRFYREDALRETLPLSKMPMAEPDRIAYGIRRDGSAASIPMNQSLLVAGKSRHGKSTIFWALLYDLVRKRTPVDLYVCDPKEGIELHQLGERLDKNTGTLRIRGYATNEVESIELMEHVNQLRIERMQRMKKRGERVHVATVEEPQIRIIIDEFLPFQDSVLRQGTKSPLGKIAYAGAAAGVTLWACSQLSEKAVLQAIRDLIQSRISVAQPNRSNTDMALGDGAHSDGANCTALQGKPGRGFSFEDGDQESTYREFRGALSTNADVELIAQGKVLEDTPLTPDGDETPIWEAFDTNNTLLWRGIDRPTKALWWNQVTTVRPTWCANRVKAMEIIVKLNKTEPPKTPKPERTLATSLEDLRRLVRR